LTAWLIPAQRTSDNDKLLAQQENLLVTDDRTAPAKPAFLSEITVLSYSIAAEDSGLLLEAWFLIRSRK